MSESVKTKNPSEYTHGLKIWTPPHCPKKKPLESSGRCSVSPPPWWGGAGSLTGRPRPRMSTPEAESSSPCPVTVAAPPRAPGPVLLPHSACVFLSLPGLFLGGNLYRTTLPPKQQRHHARSPLSGQQHVQCLSLLFVTAALQSTNPVAPVMGLLPHASCSGHSISKHLNL